ncbi:MAG: signal peptidase II [Lachnospiraceae bacterium]|jgi:signal peptidase II|nr:signal peptidase II [Lachnospiraceae bacterium]
MLSGKKKVLLLIDLAIILLLIAGDRVSKYLAVNHLKDRPAIPLIRGFLELNYLENHGAAFGMLQDQKVFLVLIAVLILFIIFYVFFKLPDDGKYTIMHILLSVLAAGAVGNMIDRLWTGYVVDFIYLVIIHFPIFNVADIYVTVSTFVLMLLFLFFYKEKDFSFLSFRLQKKYREIK